MEMNTVLMLRVSARIMVGTLLGLCAAGCSMPSPWGNEGSAGDPPAAESVRVESAGLGQSLKGVYVIHKEANGARCDDSLYTLDSDAIQQCLVKASNDGGGLVLVQAGTYSSGTWALSVGNNVTLQGVGNLGAKFSPLAVQSPISIIDSIGDNSAIRGLAFDSSFAQFAIRLGGQIAHRNVVVENNLFSANGLISSSRGTRGISSTDLTGTNTFDKITIRGNSFQFVDAVDSGSILISLSTPSAGGGSIDNVRIENNDVSASSNIYTYVRVNAGSSTTPSKGIVISGNSLRGGDSHTNGISIVGADQAQVTANAIEAGVAVNVFPSAATTCSASILGNALTSKPVIASACSAGSVVVGNSQNLAGAGMGKAGVAVRAGLGQNQNFIPGTETPIAFDVEDVDYGGNFDTSTHAFIAPFAGLYRVRACARFAASGFAASDTADLLLKVNTAVVTFNRIVIGGSSNVSSCAEDLLVMTSGATLQAAVNATGDGATPRQLVGGKTATLINIERVSD
jgi:hypothetical protein